MSSINYALLCGEEIELSLFSRFKRYQKVTRCWRKENDEWVLKDIQFTEQWGPEEFISLISCLKKTIESGGTVFGAFEDKMLVGFASLENHSFGSRKEYIQLSSLHVSYGYRCLGIGKTLFFLICEKAKEMGAKKLYISAHSSQETQAFYQAIGCVEAVEYNESLVAAEPYDCQLEYIC